MKKTLLFLLLAVASGSSAFAQAKPGGSDSSKDYTGGGVTDSRNTGFGFKGGYNFSALRGDDVPVTGASTKIDFKSRSGYHAGVYGQFGFNEFASVQVEALYSSQGFNANVSKTGNAQESYDLSYLAVPVMFVGNFTETLSFHVGPQVSLLTNVRREGNSLGISENGFNSLDYGGVVGLEARVGPARVGARYNAGLGKIFEDNIPSTAAIRTELGNSKMYNNVVQLYVGIGFTQ